VAKRSGQEGLIITIDFMIGYERVLDENCYSKFSLCSNDYYQRIDILKVNLVDI
jgi:hypothetical protein